MNSSHHNEENSFPSDAVRLSRALGQRVNLGVYLTRAAGPVAAAIITFGLFYLFAQMLAPHLTGYTYTTLILIPVALVWAWHDCQRRQLFFSESEIVELADKLSGADGLATTAWEKPALAGGAEVWSGIRQNLDFRPLRLAPAWFAWRLVPAFAFAGLVFLVPPRKPVDVSRLQVMDSLTQPLEDKLTMTAEILPETEVEKLQEQIEQLQAADPSITREKWEAVEDIQQKLEHALSQSDAAAQQLANSLAEMTELAAKKSEASSSQEAGSMQNQMDELAQNLENLLKNNSIPLDKQLQEQLAKALAECKGGNCSAADLDELRKRAQELANKVSDKLGSGKPEQTGMAGAGGISRGRADAAFDLGVERKIENATFDPQQVQNEFMDNNHLTDMGITVIEPKPDPGVFQPGTVRQYSAPEGSNVSRTQISPSQRGVVSRYFQ